MLLASTSALSQDITRGTVLAFDRMARTLVLTDRTAWSLADLAAPVPVGLKAGDRVEIRYQSNEDGISSIDGIVLMREKAQTESVQDSIVGTILVLDLDTRALILTDRSIWSLDNLESELPAGLKAGKRIEITFESDEDGVSSISSIRSVPD